MADEESSAERIKKPRNWAKTGAAMGIGSAAIVAALLYVNHAKKRPEDKR